jgi:chromosome segregation ATPase
MHRLDNEINDLTLEINRMHTCRKRVENELRGKLAELASIDAELEELNHSRCTLQEDRNDDSEHGCVDCRCEAV